MKVCYLDHAATTPVRREVIDAMVQTLERDWGNASSPHGTGRRARAVIECARAQVAGLVDCPPEAIIFTSGGTEANNLAVLGTARAGDRRHVVCGAIEHHSVLDACQALARDGFEVSWVRPDGQGIIAPKDVESALRPDTALCALMLANNEVGAVQPVRAVAEICRDRGVPLHVDAVAALGRMPVEAERLGVDLLSVSAHKIYGPQGVGALYIRPGHQLRPLLAGGGQERRWRPGTENVAAITGFGVAAELAAREWPEWVAHLEGVDAALRGRIAAAELGAIEVGPSDRNRRVAGVLSLVFPHLDGDALRTALDLADVRVGAGSACSSGSLEPSHVLLAMGYSESVAPTIVRLSAGRATGSDEVERAVAALRKAVALQWGR